LELVDASESLKRTAKVEKVFVLLSGQKSVQKVKLLSMMLIDWMKKSQMTKPDKKTNCPFRRPSSNNLRIRTCFASMKKLYC
jgi:hypothetical protein